MDVHEVRLPAVSFQRVHTARSVPIANSCRVPLANVWKLTPYSQMMEPPPTSHALAWAGVAATAIPATAVAATTAAPVLRSLMTDSFGDATTADSPGHANTDHANTPTGPELSCPVLTFHARFADVSLTS
ncbi:hypothetical protein [Streptomyces sp. NPDC058240]|uniref:hypothetical protein n=1 Tax=Streptomyces sp. NPDC058240 TaxID=3346396 RepID=UPI0036E43242